MLHVGTSNHKGAMRDLLHPSQAVRDVELGSRLLLHLLDFHTRRQLRECEAALLAVDLEDALYRVSHMFICRL